MPTEKTVTVTLTQAEAEVLASVAELTLEASGLTYADWLDANANMQSQLESAEAKMTRAYKSLETG